MAGAGPLQTMEEIHESLQANMPQPFSIQKNARGTIIKGIPLPLSLIKAFHTAPHRYWVSKQLQQLLEKALLDQALQAFQVLRAFWGAKEQILGM